jgi:hypothetical protein
MRIRHAPAGALTTSSSAHHGGLGGGVNEGSNASPCGSCSMSSRYVDASVEPTSELMEWFKAGPPTCSCDTSRGSGWSSSSCSNPRFRLCLRQGGIAQSALLMWTIGRSKGGPHRMLLTFHQGVGGQPLLRQPRRCLRHTKPSCSPAAGNWRWRDERSANERPLALLKGGDYIRAPGLALGSHAR